MSVSWGFFLEQKLIGRNVKVSFFLLSPSAHAALANITGLAEQIDPRLAAFLKTSVSSILLYLLLHEGHVSDGDM